MSSTRVLWIGDNPAMPSLSAEAGRKVARYLATAGCEVFYHAFYRTQPPSIWEGITLMPSIVFTGDAGAASGTGGRIGLSFSLDTVRPDVVISCGRLDQFFDLLALREAGKWDVPWYHWPTPEGRPDGVSPASAPYLVRTTAMPADLAFRPLADRTDARRRILAEGRFVVGSMARNILRDGFEPALARLAERFGDQDDLMMLWIEDLHRRESSHFREAIKAFPNLRHHRAYWADVAEDASALVFDLLNEHLDAYLSFAPVDGIDQGAVEAACAGTPVLHVRDEGWLDELGLLRDQMATIDRDAYSAAAVAIHGFEVVGKEWASTVGAVPRPEHGPFQLTRSLLAPVIEYTNNDNPGRLGPEFVKPLDGGEAHLGGIPVRARHLWGFREFPAGIDSRLRGGPSRRRSRALPPLGQAGVAACWRSLPVLELLLPPGAAQGPRRSFVRTTHGIMPPAG